MIKFNVSRFLIALGMMTSFGLMADVEYTANFEYTAKIECKTKLASMDLPSFVEYVAKISAIPFDGKKVIYLEDFSEKLIEELRQRHFLLKDDVISKSTISRKLKKLFSKGCAWTLFLAPIAGLFLKLASDMRRTRQGELSYNRYSSDAFFFLAFYGLIYCWILAIIPALCASRLSSLDGAYEDLEKIWQTIICSAMFEVFAKGYTITSRNADLAARLAILFDDEGLANKYREAVAKYRMNGSLFKNDWASVLKACSALKIGFPVLN